MVDEIPDRSSLSETNRLPGAGLQVCNGFCDPFNLPADRATPLRLLHRCQVEKPDSE